VPLDPVTWIELALVSVTVSVTVCPEVMLLELAVIETVGTAAEALAAKTEIATKVSKRVREEKVFTWACLRRLVHVPDCALGGEVVPAGVRPPRAGYERWTDTKPFDACSLLKGSNPNHCTVVTKARCPRFQEQVLCRVAKSHAEALISRWPVITNE